MNESEYTLIEKFNRFLQKNITKIIIYTILIFILTILYLIFNLIYSILNIALPSFLCSAVNYSSINQSNFILLLYNRMMYNICRYLTFPGSTFLLRRKMENYFGKGIREKCIVMIENLQSIIEMILSNQRFPIYTDAITIYEIRTLLMALISNFKNQKDNGNLSSNQESFYEMLIKLEKYMKEVKIIHIANQLQIISFWKFFELNEYANNTFSFENQVDGQNILSICRMIYQRLLSVYYKKNLFSSAIMWLYDDMLGSIDQIRENLISRYNGKRIFIKVEKKITLDCMLLISKSQNNDNHENQESLEGNNLYNEKYNHRYKRNDSITTSLFNEKPNLGNTIIFCNPNAGLYEYMYSENEWIEYYLERGISLFLWNYRGYGRSKGKPNPNNLKRDAEIIVDYIRSNYNVKKLGVHGESMGGMVAVHIACVKNLDYVCAGRTFSSIIQVILASFGWFVSGIYYLLTLWSYDSSDNYLDASCYKILTFDPKDDVIPIDGSLKYGVSQKIIERRLGIKKYDSSYNFLRGSFILNPKNLWPFFIKTISNMKNRYKMLLLKLKLQRNNNNMNINNNNGLLTSDMMKILFKAIYRISSIILIMSKTENLEMKKYIKPKKKISETPRSESKSFLELPRKALTPRNNRTHHKDFPIKSPNDNTTTNNDNTNIGIKFKSAGKLHNERNYLNDVCDETMLEMMRYTGKNHHDENIIIDSNNSSKIIIDDIPKDLNSYEITQKDCQKMLCKEPYTELLDLNTQSSKDFLRFIKKVFSLFHIIEAGGIHLTNICCGNEKRNQSMFKEFIRSLEIWGSYQPIKYIYRDEIKDISRFHMNTMNKIKKFIKKTDKLIHAHKDKQLSLVELKIVEDLEIILSIFSLIHQKLSESHDKSTKDNYLQNGMLTPSDFLDISIQKNYDIETQRKSINFLKSDNDDLDIQQQQHQLINISTLGNLFPLSCGHNGSLNYHERLLLDYHLKNAGFLE